MAEPPAPASSIPDSVPAVGFDDEDAQHLSASDMRGHRTLSTSSAGSSSMPSLSRTTSTHSTAESEGGFQEGVDLLASSGLPLAEMLETFWDSRVDLIDRKWKTFSDEIKHNARNKRDKLVHRAKSRTEVKIMQKEAQKLRKGVRIQRLGAGSQVSGRTSDPRWIPHRSPIALTRSRSVGTRPRRCAYGTRSPSSSAR